MGFLRKIKSIGSKNIHPVNAMRNRVGKLKRTSYKTVNGLAVYITPSGRNYVTKNRTPVYTFGINNGRGIVFTTGKKVTNTGYYGMPVFETKSGAYVSSSGKGLWKHKNGKYYNYA